MKIDCDTPLKIVEDNEPRLGQKIWRVIRVSCFCFLLFVSGWFLGAVQEAQKDNLVIRDMSNQIQRFGDEMGFLSKQKALRVIVRDSYAGKPTKGAPRLERSHR